ncbi:hypothetical protein [Allokutzneria oryzae]|uniref:Uncharacterized protein n=1 Tax=Allokutzneria oryzae TaxID=1378989 RepID=A0ABV5ZYS4_9PSEU
MTARSPLPLSVIPASRLSSVVYWLAAVGSRGRVADHAVMIVLR